MTYDRPLVIASPNPVCITKVKHGVTEISLSDGRVMRLTIHVEGLRPDAKSIDVSYAVITEVMAAPDVPIMDQHERVQ